MEKFTELDRRLLVYAAVVLACIGYMLNEPLMQIDFWVVLGTLGTTGAVWAALRVAGRADRRQADAELARAKLAAARLVPELHWAAASLGLAKAAYLFTPLGYDSTNPDHEREHYGRCARSLKSCLERPEWDLDPNLVRDLIPLQGHAALRLEYACRLLVTLKREAAPILATWLDFPTKAQAHYIEQWSGVLFRADDYITVAMRTCEQAADAKRLLPTGEELYGLPIDYDED